MTVKNGLKESISISDIVLDDIRLLVSAEVFVSGSAIFSLFPNPQFQMMIPDSASRTIDSWLCGNGASIRPSTTPASMAYDGVLRFSGYGDNGWEFGEGGPQAVPFSGSFSFD